MLWPAVFASCAFGAVVAFFFILYFLSGEAEGGKKVGIEFFIGAGGNGTLTGLVFFLIPEEEQVVRLISIGCCFASFFVITGILLCIFAFVIKGRDGNNVVRLRDIFLGQYPFVKKYYEERAQEIRNKLNIEALEQRELAVTQRENIVSSAETYIEEELARIEELGKKKLRIKLPENKNITLNQDYIATMPSYISDFFTCIQHVYIVTEELLRKIEEGEETFVVTESVIKTYLLTIAGHISADLFGGNSSDARIHFRIYDREKNGYEKYLAIMGSNTNVLFQPMTFIPYNEKNMIAKSYECRRALIKSLNSGHHYKGNNYRVWQEYLTYTFTDLLVDGKPFLSFGISIKNVERYKKLLHFINYFRLEAFLQNNIEKIHNAVDMASIFYGGTT